MCKCVFLFEGAVCFLHQGLTATLTLRRAGEVALVPGTQVSYQVALSTSDCKQPGVIVSCSSTASISTFTQEGHWGFFLLPPWPGVGEVTVALYGFKARGSPYTVRVLALKLEEEDDQMEVSLLNSYNNFFL